MDKGITQEEKDLIHQTQLMEGEEMYSKKILNNLKKIKEKVTGVVDRECFCSSIRRRIWYREFMNWYETNS